MYLFPGHLERWEFTVKNKLGESTSSMKKSFLKRSNQSLKKYRQNGFCYFSGTFEGKIMYHQNDICQFNGAKKR